MADGSYVVGMKIIVISKQQLFEICNTASRNIVLCFGAWRSHGAER